MSVGIIGRPACKLALCVALFMPIRLCDTVTADAPPAPGYPSDHGPGRTTWEGGRGGIGGGRKHSLHNTQIHLACEDLLTHSGINNCIPLEVITFTFKFLENFKGLFTPQTIKFNPFFTHHYVDGGSNRHNLI